VILVPTQIAPEALEVILTDCAFKKLLNAIKN
jgi:hypothetical protein